MRLPHVCSAVLLGAALVAVTGCGDKPADAPAPAPQVAAAEVKVEDWGPRETGAGKPFNVQPNGKSALWIKVTGLNASAGVKLFVGDALLEDVNVATNLVTASLPAQNTLLDKPGDQAVVLVEGATNRKVQVGTFKVLPQ